MIMNVFSIVGGHSGGAEGRNVNRKLDLNLVARPSVTQKVIPVASACSSGWRAWGGVEVGGAAIYLCIDLVITSSVIL